MSNDVTSRFKTLNFKIPQDVWAFYKKISIDKDVPIHDLIVECLISNKKKLENKVNQAN